MAALGSVSSWFAASTAESSACDVFLNFWGEDTRKNFTVFLNQALKNCGINVFMDAGLSPGDEIGPTLLRAIDNAKISIVVFSQNYAHSKWCMKELVQIVQCHRSKGQKILPIFYDVEPFHLRHQIEYSHERYFEPNTIASWREALRLVGNLSGVFVDKTMDQAEVVDQVVKKVLNILVPNSKFAELMQMLKSFKEFVINSSMRIRSLETTISHREAMIFELEEAIVERDQEIKRLRDEEARS